MLQQKMSITKTYIKKVLRKEGEIIEMKTRNLCKDGENFVSTPLEVKFSFVEFDSNTVESFNLAVKIPNENSLMYSAIAMVDGFQKETLMYKKLMPDALKWQMKNLGEIKHYFPSPNSYYCGEDGIIIMENLEESNYYVKPMKTERNLEESKILVKSIAKFHAIMMAFSQSFESISDFVEQYSFIKNASTEFQTLFDPPNSIQEKIELIKPIIDDLSKLFPDKIPLFDKYWEYILSSNNMTNTLMHLVPCEGYSVVCHGDLWNNNILFYTDESGQVADCKLIDFQLMKFSTPVLDISHFLWMSGSKDVILYHRKELLLLYYEVLQNVMKDLNSDLRLSFEQLWNDFERLNELGLATGIMNGLILFAPNNNAVDAVVCKEDVNLVTDSLKQIGRVMKHPNDEILSRLNSLIQLGHELNFY